MHNSDLCSRRINWVPCRYNERGTKQFLTNLEVLLEESNICEVRQKKSEETRCVYIDVGLGSLEEQLDTWCSLNLDGTAC